MKELYTRVVENCVDRVQSETENTPVSRTSESCLVIAGVAVDMIDNPDWGRDALLAEVFDDNPAFRAKRRIIRRAAANLTTISGIMPRTPEDTLLAIERGEVVSSRPPLL